ncbi:MAG: hypothetical protein GYA60_01935 [Candidatus Methanofastidiosa archaeon]|nr:hypothetical protein [Candidatus Methanofastidiosa archaeon]
MISFLGTIRKRNDSVVIPLKKEVQPFVEVGKSYQITIDEIGVETRPEVKNHDMGAKM